MRNQKFWEILCDFIYEDIKIDNLSEMISKIEEKFVNKYSLEYIKFIYVSSESLYEFSYNNKFKYHEKTGKYEFNEKTTVIKENSSLKYIFPINTKNKSIEAVVILKKSKKFDDKQLPQIENQVKTIFLFFLRLHKAKKLALYDELTDLYNQKYIKEYLSKEEKRSLRYHTKFSIIFLDLDGLNKVNDEHGHLMGARALKELGKLLKENSRNSDIIGRHGGDEFIIILPGTNKKEAENTANRIRDKIKQNIFLEEYDLKVKLTASMGISCFPDDTTNIDSLINKADRAMYITKKKGKDGVEAYKEDL